MSTPSKVYLPFHGCFGRFSTASSTYYPFEEEWTQVRGKNKRSEGEDFKSEFEISKLGECFDGVRSNATKVFIGVAPQERESFKHNTSHKPQKARVSTKKTKKSYKCKHEDVNKMSDENFNLLLAGFEANLEKLNRYGEVIDENIEKIQIAVEKSKEAISTQRLFHRKLYDLEMERLPLVFRNQAAKVYHIAKYRRNILNQAKKITWNGLNDHFDHLGTCDQKLDNYDCVLHAMSETVDQAVIQKENFRKHRKHFKEGTKYFMNWAGDIHTHRPMQNVNEATKCRRAAGNQRKIPNKHSYIGHNLLRHEWRRVYERKPPSGQPPIPMSKKDQEYYDDFDHVEKAFATNVTNYNPFNVSNEPSHPLVPSNITESISGIHWTPIKWKDNGDGWSLWA
jgi:hypothetical protein